MKTTLAKTIRALHLWMGLGIGALFCILSLSGSVLVLRPVLEDGLRPAWKSTSAARPEMVVTEATHNIAHQWPDAKVGSVVFPAEPGGPIEFGVRTAAGEEMHVFADASSGEVLGTFDLPWLAWLTGLHHHVLVESVGKKIVGFIGLLLVLSSLSGLLIWVRRSNPWRLFGMRRGTGWQFTKFDLHRSVGVIGNLLLLFVAATGVTIAFPQTIAYLLGAPAQPRFPSVKSGSAGHATLEEYIASAQGTVPGGTVTQVRLARTPDRPVTIRMRLPGDIRLEGSTRVSLEAGTARVLSLDKPDEWPLSRKIVQAAGPLHYGEWGALPVRILWAIVGFMPPVLFVSGTLMWWTPFRARAAKRPNRRATRDGAGRESGGLSGMSLK